MKTLSYRERVKKLERRRLRAGKMFHEGKTQAEVAQHFEVTRAAACQWFAAWSADNKNGLVSKGLSGPHPILTPKQKRTLKQKILSGPVKAGYETDFWTLERIRLVARKVLHVDLGTTSIWRTVIALGFSVQKPERRARERDEQAISSWKMKSFPRLKKMGQETQVSHGLSR